MGICLLAEREVSSKRVRMTTAAHFCKRSAHHSVSTSLIISFNEEIVMSLRQTVEMSVLLVKCMHIADSLLCLPAQKGNVNNLDKPGKWGHVGALSGRFCGLHHKNVPLLLSWYTNMMKLCIFFKIFLLINSIVNCVIWKSVFVWERETEGWREVRRGECSGSS